MNEMCILHLGTGVTRLPKIKNKGKKEKHITQKAKQIKIVGNVIRGRSKKYLEKDNSKKSKNM